MEKFKKEIWERDNLDFEYNSLNNIQTQKILDEVAELCNISIENIDNCCIFINLSKRLNKLFIPLDINEKEGFHNLCSIFKLDTYKSNSIYMIWNYNEIDKIKISVLQKYWDYIWYGTSDEICLLYFSDIKLIIMITDYGIVKSNLKQL